MPILFDELERLLLKWKRDVEGPKATTSRVGHMLYNSIKEKTDERYIKQIKILFESISIKDIDVNEVLNPDRTYGKLTIEKEITIKKKSRL